MVLKSTDALTVIADGLGWIEKSCEKRGLLKLFDNHIGAQRFFCQFLNAAFDLELKLMDNDRPNYPAIDLGDKTKRIAYQITTEKKSDKVQDTLDTFVKHKLNQDYDALKILVIGHRQKTYQVVKVPVGLKFDCDQDILDINGLIKIIDTLDTPHLEKLRAIIEREIKGLPTRGLAALRSKFVGLSLSSALLVSAALAARRGELTFDIGVDRDGFSTVRTSEVYPPERMLRYTATAETTGGEKRIVVKPDMGYLTTLESGAPIEAIKFFHNPFLCQFPNLDVTFVNNTRETLAVTGAMFEVAESVPDMRPLILFKDDNARMILRISNDGWGTVRNAVLRCNIVPTGSEEIRPDPPIGHISIAGPYRHEFAIGDFEEKYELNLESTVAGLGVDIKAIMEAGFRSQMLYVEYAMRNGLDEEAWQHFGRFPNLDTNDAWKPFPDGYAVVAGLLEYDEDSGGGVTTRRSLPFRVRIFLFKTWLSVPMPPSYQYNVSLRPDGKNYKVFCPVSHSLKMGEADRIRIYIACERSATHTFRIRWLLNGGKEAISEPIALTHFVPRTWSRRRKTMIEVGPPPQDASDQPPQGPGSNIGCVEQTILDMEAIFAARNRAENEREKQSPPPGDKPAEHLSP